MIFLTVHHRKGGVGKTSTVQNLAIAFSQMAQLKTLAVDITSQGNLTSSLGLKKPDKEEGTAGILRAVLKEDPIRLEKYICKARDQLDLLAGSSELDDIQSEIANFDGHRASILKEALKFAPRSYDVVLIDTDPENSWLVKNALVASGKVLIPVECENFSADGLMELFSNLERLARSNKTRVEILGVVATKFNESRNSHKTILSLLKKQIPDRVFSTVIHSNSKIESAQNAGKSVLEFSPRVRSSREYQNLAEEILDRVSKNGT